MNPSDMSIDAPVPEPVDEGEDEASVEREPRSVALRIMDIR